MSKRFLLISFLLLCLCSAVRAQVSIGIQAGPTFPLITNILQGYNGAGGSVTQNSQSITRFYGGFNADIPLDKRKEFIVRPGLLYLGAGGKTPELTDFNGNAIALQTEYHLDCLQVPLQFLLSPTLSFGKPWIGGGLYGSLLFGAKGKTTAGPGDLKIGNSAGDDLKRFDLGYIFSAGLTLKFGILAGVDFQQSLSTIVPHPPAGQPTIRNSIWGVHLGNIANIGGGSRSGR